MDHSESSPSSKMSVARRISNESESGHSSSPFGNIFVANEHAYSSGSRSPRRSSPSQVELHGQITENGNVRKLVEHNYHDYSQVPAPSPSISDGASGQSEQLQQPTTVFVTRGGTATLFPLKLYGILDDAMSADPSRDRQLPGVPNGQILSQIVCFQPHGRAFKVQDVALFKECVLPVYFGKMKYSSFLRQLNLYGFTRISRGADKGGYYHELFLQHREFLIYRIQRMKVKGSGTRAAANPDQEPNFYSMTYMRDIPFPTESSNGADNLPKLNPKLVAAAHKMSNNSANSNANQKRKAATPNAGQSTSDVDAILDDNMLLEPNPVSISPAARSTHRQVSMTSGDLMDFHSSLDSFNFDAVEGNDDVTDNFDLDLSELEDLLANEPSDVVREETDSTQAVAPSPLVSSGPRFEPRPMAVPPPLMSHAAAARYNASFATSTAASSTTISAMPSFDNSEINFLHSLFADEASVAAVPMSPIKIAAAAKMASAGISTTTMKNPMDAAANAQADYRNSIEPNGGRLRFQNIRAARTA